MSKGLFEATQTVTNEGNMLCPSFVKPKKKRGGALEKREKGQGVVFGNKKKNWWGTPSQWEKKRLPPCERQILAAASKYRGRRCQHRGGAVLDSSPMIEKYMHALNGEQ